MNSLYNTTSRNCTGVGNATSCASVGNSPIPPWYYSSFNVTFMVLYTLIIVAALIGNILVCLAVCINSNLRQNPSSYYIVSLAISDIGTTCFSMTFDLESFMTHSKWYHGEAMCVIWTTAYLITVPSSIWNLFILSIDRYTTLKNPWKRYKESHSLTTRRAAVTITMLWIYCFAFALLPVMGWRDYPKSVYNNYCRFNITVNFSIVGSVFNFYLPMFAMCCIYYKVYQIARAHIKFPLTLKTRYNTASGNGSGGSTLNISENLARVPSMKQHQNSDLPTQETAAREVVGLENVSFRLDENLKGQSIKKEEDDEREDKVRVNPLGITNIEKPRKTNQCVNTRSGDSLATKNIQCHRQYRDDLKGCDSTDNDIQHLEAQSRAGKTVKKDNGADEESGEPKNKTKFFSDERIKKYDEYTETRGADVEGDQCVTKEKNAEQPIPKSATWEVLDSRNVNDHDMEKLDAGPNDSKNEAKRKRSRQERFQYKAQLKTSISLNSSERFYQPGGPEDKSQPYAISSPTGNSLYKQKNKFLFGKHLKMRSDALNDDQSCHLKKFHKRSIEDESIENRRESNSDTKYLPPGELNETFERQRDSLTRSNQRRLKLMTKNTKAARTISIIVGAFLICWMPFTTLSIAFNICSKPCWKLIPPQVFYVLLWFGYLNSALNPVLFSYRNMEFRKSYRQIASAVVPCMRNQ